MTFSPFELDFHTSQSATWRERIICGNLGFCRRQRHGRAFRQNLCKIRCVSNPVWDLKAIGSDQIWFHLWAAGFTLALRLPLSCCWVWSSIHVTLYLFFCPLSLLFTRIFNFYSNSAVCCFAICWSCLCQCSVCVCLLIYFFRSLSDALAERTDWNFTT